MQHPDPNRKKEPCKDKCVACKACKDREKLKLAGASKPAPQPNTEN